MEQATCKIDWEKNGRILKIMMTGRQAPSDAEQIVSQINEMVVAKGQQGKVNLLIDLSRVNVGEQQVRKIWGSWLKSEVFIRYVNKDASFGADVFTKVVTNFIISASGVKNIKFFSVEKEARQWLNEK